MAHRGTCDRRVLVNLPKCFEDFLRKIWKSKIEFEKLDSANPGSLPIG